MSKKYPIPRICIIISYFGKLPTYFSVWKKSCEYNSMIDFMVFTDIEKPELSANIKWINMDLKDLKNLAEEKLGMRIKLDTPYECCDFKAVYGTIFEDYLSKYDYWGYCDMDMVFGDLAWWFYKLNLSKYDKFLGLGHLTLMRNTKENNERYKLPCTPGKGYKDAFLSEGSTHFCEGEINRIYNCYGFPFFEKRICADISAEFERLRVGGNYPDYKHQAFFWQNGKVWRVYRRWNTVGIFRKMELEEFAYIHFQKRKMKEPQFDVEHTNAFYICPHEFVEKNTIGYPSINEIKKMNPYRGKLFETIEKVKYFALVRAFNKQQ